MCGNGYLVNLGGVKPQPLSFSILNQPIGSRRVTEALVLSAGAAFRVGGRRQRGWCNWECEERCDGLMGLMDWWIDRLMDWGSKRDGCVWKEWNGIPKRLSASDEWNQKGDLRLNNFWSSTFDHAALLTDSLNQWTWTIASVNLLLKIHVYLTFRQWPFLRLSSLLTRALAFTGPA